MSTRAWKAAKLNSKSTEDLVRLIEFEGEEWLYYKAPKIDVALIRGTVADEHGNITLDKEGMLLEQLSIAQAARACGGIVICQVERIVKAGTLHPKAVKIPGVVIDYVVLSQPQNHMQSIATQFDPRCAATSACPPAACRRWRWMSARSLPDAPPWSSSSAPSPTSASASRPASRPSRPRKA